MEHEPQGSRGFSPNTLDVPLLRIGQPPYHTDHTPRPGWSWRDVEFWIEAAFAIGLMAMLLSGR